MLLALASVVFLESESLGLVTIFYCLRFETSLPHRWIPVFSYILSALTTHRKHSPSIVA
jgi:hypothetical protein